MLPILREEKTNSKAYIVDFKGLNLGEGWQDGDFADSYNVSSALYPCITQRYGRDGRVFTIKENPMYGDRTYPVEALANKNGVIVVMPPYVIHGDVPGFMHYNLGLTSGRKHIASVGDILIIFPDKVWFNTITGESGKMNEELTATGAVFTDSSIQVTGATFPFRVGDAITISGCTQAPENNKSIIIRGIDGDTLTFYSNQLTAATETAAVNFLRYVPDMDAICESNNRLWGAKDSTIYASKYGDPLNFSYHEGTASDSYAIEVGTDGKFTGAAPYGSHVCFFKENCMHKMYGTMPSNYQVTTALVHGVQEGSERSLVNVNETLYYKGVNGVYAYGGGVPELISSAFGAVRFADACATSDGDRYYISMRNGDTWHLMVYDILRGIWLREDDSHCVDMTLADGKVWMLLADGKVHVVNPDSEERSMVDWSITLCPFTETMNERKGYSKFTLRASLAEGAWLKLEYRCDNNPVWTEAFAVTNAKARTVTFPILPERCDCIQLRISGKGECILRTLVREFHVGSDV